MQDASGDRAELVSRVRRLEHDVDALRRRLADAGRDDDSALLQVLLEDIRERRRVEAELARAREWMELAQAAAGVCTYEYDIRNRRLTWSASTSQLYGLPASTSPSVRSWLNFVHPQDRAGAAANAGASLETGQPIVQSYRIVRPDGDVRWIEDRGHALLDEKGAPVRVIGLNIDVTDLRRAREAAAYSRRLRKLVKLLPAMGADPDVLQALLDSLPVGIMICDASRTQVYMNEALNRMWRGGRPIERVKDWARYRAWHVSTGELVGVQGWPVVKAIETGRPNDAEVRFQRFDGEFGYMVVSATPLTDPQGQVVWSVAVAQDITERRATEERVHLRDELLRRVGETTPDLIFVKDRESRMIYANRSLLSMIGKGWDEIAGRTDAEWHHDPDEAAAFLESDAGVMETGESQAVEEVHTGTAGQRTYLASKTPLRDRSGAVVGVIGVATDISDRKRAENRTRLLAKEMRHRMKNTLATVQAMARHSFGREAATAKAFDEFEMRLVALGQAHDLLAEKEWSTADVVDVVERTLAPHRGASISIEGPPATLSAQNALALSMALNELCTNASKYGALSSKEGIVRVAWRLEAERMRLVWCERGGPPVQAPERPGFGLRMIRQAFAHDPLGSVQVAFDPEGLHAALHLSIADPGLHAGAHI